MPTYNKQIRSWFFTTTGDSKINNFWTRFVGGGASKPSEQTMANLTASVPFFKEIDSSASVDIGQALENKQGLVVIAADQNAKDGINTVLAATGGALVVKPSQLPTVEQTVNDFTVTTVPTDGISTLSQVVFDIVPDITVTTKNKYLVKLSTPFVKWLLRRVVPSGGTATQVLSKTSIDDFDVSWTDVSGDSIYGYNTVVPTTTTVGGVFSGTTFTSSKLVKDVIFQMLNPYQSPAISSLSSILFTNYEVGQSLPSGLQTVSYVISNAGNIKSQPPPVGVPSTTIPGAIFPVNPVTLSGAGSFQITIPPSVTSTTPANNSITLTGTNSLNVTFSQSNTVSWLYKIYFGNSAITIPTAGQILGLTGELGTSPNRTYNLTGGNYKYIAFPDTFSSPSLFKDVSGFGVAMAGSSGDSFFNILSNGYYYGILPITSVYGVTTQYRVYRTANQIVSLNIQVS